MVIAFSIPAAIFLAVPVGIVLLVSSRSVATLAETTFFLLAVLMPLYATGFVLAPWAGSRVPSRKGPAFVMSVAAASSSALAVGCLAGVSGGAELGVGMAATFAFFAVPASLLGALFFIGGCARIQARQA
jgi:hypothetical protein